MELNVSQQRLDSTHVFSHMAMFGRVNLMAVAIKRCLTQVKRHAPDDYAALPDELRVRYAPSEGRLFADAKDAAARASSKQQVAEDTLLIIERFADRTEINGCTSLVKIFQQQCEVVEGRVVVLAKTGGDVIQNPSDLDATYDGHKGQGYQIQLSETCSTDNDVQLIVGAIPETASANDSDAVRAMLEQLAAHGLIPAEMPADTAYGSDENVLLAESFGVELIAPVPGRAPHVDPQALTLDDFAHHEETGAVEACPASHAPLRVTRDEATHTTVVEMSATACASGPLLKLCPIHQTKDGRFELSFTDQARRLAARRPPRRTSDPRLPRTLRTTIRHRIHQQRPQESPRSRLAESPRSRCRLPNPAAQSQRLEHPASRHVSEAPRPGPKPDRPTPQELAQNNFPISSRSFNCKPKASA